MGHEVVVTADGLQAWNQLRDRPERLVISDWMMPVMSGLELCRKIRAERIGTGCRVTASFGVATIESRRIFPTALEGLRIRRRAGSDRWWRSRGPSRGRRRGCGPRLTGCQAQSSSMISSESSMTTGIKGSRSSCLPALEGGAMMSCSDEETTISRGEGSGKPCFNAVPAAAGGDRPGTRNVGAGGCGGEGLASKPGPTPAGCLVDQAERSCRAR